MQTERELSPDEVAEIGQALYGEQWKTALARALGTPRQSIDHYLKAGVRGTQASALVGVISTFILAKRAEEDQARAAFDQAEADLKALHGRFAARLGW